MQVELITPDKQVFSGQARSATFPGSKGSFQVLDNHAALVSTLERGEVVIDTPDAGRRSFVVEGGVVEVLDNRVLVLAEAVL